MKSKLLKKNSKKEEKLGDIRIRADVIHAIILSTLKEIDGIVKMGSTFTQGFKQFLSPKNLHKGIKVNIIENKKTNVKILIIAEYGRNIPQLSCEIQEKVKKAIESMTGLSVGKIDVEIQRLEMKKNNKKKEG